MRKRWVAAALAVMLGGAATGALTHHQRVAQAQTLSADDTVDRAMALNPEDEPAIAHPHAARIHPRDVAHAAGLTEPIQ